MSNIYKTETHLLIKAIADTIGLNSKSDGGEMTTNSILARAKVQCERCCALISLQSLGLARKMSLSVRRLLPEQAGHTFATRNTQ